MVPSLCVALGWGWQKHRPACLAVPTAGLCGAPLSRKWGKHQGSCQPLTGSQVARKLLCLFLGITSSSSPAIMQAQRG